MKTQKPLVRLNIEDGMVAEAKINVDGLKARIKDLSAPKSFLLWLETFIHPVEFVDDERGVSPVVRRPLKIEETPVATFSDENQAKNFAKLFLQALVDEYNNNLSVAEEYNKLELFEDRESISVAFSRDAKKIFASAIFRIKVDQIP